MSEVVVASQQKLVGKYKPYSEYRDSGIVWFGKVPIAWSWTALKRVVSAERPITYGIVQAGPNIEDGIPYVRPTDMTDEDGIKEGIELLKTSDEIAKSYRRSMVDSGDIICSIGPSFGKLMIVPDSLRGANLTQGTARVAIAINHDTRYFFWCLRSLSSYQQWESSIGGATFRALNLGPLADTLVPLPPVKEQSLIAAFLDYETARIDRLIAQQQRLIELFKEKRQAVISHAVTKGLNPDAPMKDSGVEWLGQVPEHWVVARLKQVIEIGSSISYGIVQPGDALDEGIPFIQTTNISQGNLDLEALPKTSELIEKNYPRSRLSGGEVILGIRASIGAAYVVPNELKGVNLSRGVARIQPSNLISSEFLVWFFQTNAVDQYWGLSKQGSTFSEVSIETVRELCVVLPPEKEQQEICSYVQSISSKLKSLVDSAEHQNKLLMERRTALISAAVTGKIDLRGWELPNG